MTFPFTAVVGQEQMRHALVLVAINPAISGVLLRGEKGTAKSTVVRALARLLPSGRMRTLALGATEDRVTGGLDLEQTLRAGSPVLSPGLLAEVDGGICYVDEVNLLDDHLVDIVLDAAASGKVVVEREGLSATARTAFSLVGTMNPEEGALRPQLLDRFGLCVDVVGQPDPKTRTEVLVRQLAFDRDPDAFAADWVESERELAERLAAGRYRVRHVRTPAAVLELIVSLCEQAGVAGHRADVVMAHAARAEAAWHGRSEVNQDDVLAIAELVLNHRRRDHVPEQPDQTPPRPSDHDSSDHPDDRQDESDEPSDGQHPDDSNSQPDGGSGQQPEETLDEAAPDDRDQPDSDHSDTDEQQPPDSPPPALQGESVDAPGESFRVQPLEIAPDRFARSGSGRRQATISADARGHYVTSRPSDNAHDLALDATLRAAAPHQLARKHRAAKTDDPRAGLAVLVEPDDWRKAVRVTKVGSAIIFCVDASGSMGARGRMAASKGAVLSLLVDAYVRRDQVALISFRRDGAQVLVPPTTSVEAADRSLRELPVGGRTPLASGIDQAYRMARTLMLKQPGLRPLVILITDGRSNVALDGSTGHGAKGEAADVARQAGTDERVQWVVVDSEDPRALQLHQATGIAQALGAPCLTIDDLKADDLVGLVRGLDVAPPGHQRTGDAGQ